MNAWNYYDDLTFPANQNIIQQRSALTEIALVFKVILKDA